LKTIQKQRVKEVSVASKDKCNRYNEGKPRLAFNLLSHPLNKLEADCWEYGSKKYAYGQWLKGMSHIESAESVLRHLTDWLSGEDIDPESGLPHVGLMLTATKIFVHSVITRPDLDDRPKEPTHDDTSSSNTGAALSESDVVDHIAKTIVRKYAQQRTKEKDSNKDS
jgi:hypothetical protein